MKYGLRVPAAVAVAALLLGAAVVAGLPTLALAQADGTSTAQATDTEMASAADAWPTHRNDVARSGATTADGPGPYGNVSWEAPFSGAPEGGPAVADGVAYLAVTSDDPMNYGIYGAVGAHNTTTGDVVWDREDLGAPAGPPTVVDDTVYVATNGDPRPTADDDELVGGLYAFDATTGETRWLRNGSVNWRSAPIHVGDSLYAVRDDVRRPVNDRFAGEASPTNGSQLQAIEPATGNTTWSAPADALVGAADGAVVVRDGDQLVAYDLADHDERFRVNVSERLVVEKAALDDGTLFAVDEVRGDLVAISLADGSPSWTTSVADDSIIDYAPAVANGTVYVHAGEALVSVDAATQAENWRYEPPSGELSGPPTVGNDTVYVGASMWSETHEPGERASGDDSNEALAVLAIDRADGSLEWGVSEGQGPEPLRAIATGPVVVDDALYVVDHMPVGPNVDEGGLHKVTAADSPPPARYQPSDGEYEVDRPPEARIDTETIDDGEPFGETKTVRLDANESDGVDDELVSYEWDVDDDGEFERSGRSIDVTLEEDCELRTITLRVTDANGDTDTDSTIISNG